MSVREDQENKNCPSRGLGVAAAAIGVGVGAALYYFFSKRSEHPDNEGATSSNWNNEQSHAFSDYDDSYTTVSEHSTTDTSIAETSFTSENSQYTDFESSIISNSEYTNASDVSDSYSDTDWDVVSSSSDVHVENRSPMISLIGRMSRAFPKPKRDAERERLAALRQQAFAERSWTGEQCSICFDLMHRNQDVMVLPCTHRFHEECILPWLQEKQTCPYCRKEA